MITTGNFRTFSSSLKLIMITTISQGGTPSITLETTNLYFSASIDFPILDISYKWDHTIYGLLCQTSVT